MRRAFSVLAVAVTFLIGTTAPAWAVLADTHFRFGTISFLTDGPNDNAIDGTITNFEGYIKAEKPAKCLGGRTITIKKRQNGTWILFGSSTTDTSGFWSVNGNQYEGKYEFIASANKVGNVTCIHDVAKGWAY